MSDEILVLVLILAFATWVTAHAALAAGLAARKPEWRALVAFAVFPLAPYWGARAGMHKRVVWWVVSGVAYVAFRLMALH